jgi:hypothetical protein
MHGAPRFRDRIKGNAEDQRPTEKMLSSHGALLSDERLPLEVLDIRKLKTVEGRVLAHGEEEVGKHTGRHYLLLEGTDEPAP